MKNKRLWIVIGIIVATLVIATVLFPPRNTLQTGSTYSKFPDGYGAWYRYMKDQGYDIKQWRKSEAKFLENPPKQNATLVRVYPELSYGYVIDKLVDWVKAGNCLVMVGLFAPASNAPFDSHFATNQGLVKVETKRRLPLDNYQYYTYYRLPTIERALTIKSQLLLTDKFGAVGVDISLGKGHLVYIVTPYLAANAYQDWQGNFAFLAELVRAKTNQIFVDEYLHGYMDKEELKEERNVDDWLSYLAQTPVAVMVLQLGCILLLLIWANNRRFGNIIPLFPPVKNNNLDYINALSEVLFKAERYEFLVDKIARAEQNYLQQKLGLGSSPLSLGELAETWSQKTKRPPQELLGVLHFNRSVSDIKSIFNWLKLLFALRTQLD
ncbi:MAG: DUF4350 domain-containing protein [Pseudanabaenaceae cyanobacterium SKYGB_i_bin29]|nr:DUF4350 domain-containing protein [Pseudanabaenaceae cyanobacterium SKYG29]MDW8421729.1 DUF4350 domain-containing protein [Pseudanabaenaceae cyanobacterium SKYGB_i_bin29]